MSSIAVEEFRGSLPMVGLTVPPDLHFGKGPSKRGRSRQFGGTKHHARREELLSHREQKRIADEAGKPARGGRVAVLERVMRPENDVDLEEIEQERTGQAQKRCRKIARRQRKRINAERRETAEVRWLQVELCKSAASELAFLKNPMALEEEIEDLAEDSEIGDHSLAVAVEHICCEALAHQAQVAS